MDLGIKKGEMEQGKRKEAMKKGGRDGEIG